MKSQKPITTNDQITIERKFNISRLAKKYRIVHRTVPSTSIGVTLWKNGLTECIKHVTQQIIGAPEQKKHATQQINGSAQYMKYAAQQVNGFTLCMNGLTPCPNYIKQHEAGITAYLSGINFMKTSPFLTKNNMKTKHNKSTAEQKANFLI